MNILNLIKINNHAFPAAVVIFCMVAGFASLHAKGVTDNIPGYTSEAIKLPDPLQKGNTSTEEAILKRRSVRSYSDTPLTLKEISQLLWAAQGITDPGGLRAAPSAGALYPLEMYIIAGNVDNLPDGVYHYRPHTHELAGIVTGDKRNELCSAALGQSPVRTAAAVILFSAVYERTTVKYGSRGIQYVHMEAGHAAQNVFLQSVSLDLGTVVIGAFDDGAVTEILKLPAGEQPLYIMPVGRMK